MRRRESDGALRDAWTIRRLEGRGYAFQIERARFVVTHRGQVIRDFREDGLGGLVKMRVAAIAAALEHEQTLPPP